MGKRRIPEIDIAKGIVILSVIIGHLVKLDGGVFKWIFSFHMPFFFFASGYCTLENKKFSLLRTAEKLLIPFLIVRSIYILRGRFNVETYSDAAYHLFVEPNIAWFFSAMFISLLLMQVYIHVDRLIQNHTEKVFFAGLCVSLSLYGVIRFVSLGYHDKLPVPFKVDCAFLGFIFTLIGWWIRNRTDIEFPAKLSKRDVFWGVLIGIVLTVFTVKNSYVNMADIALGISDVYYLFAAVYWSIFILTICKIFATRKSCCPDASPTQQKESLLAYLGKRTLFIYPVHSMIHYELNNIFSLMGHNFVPMSNLPWYMVIVYFIIDMIVLMICLKLIDCIKKITGSKAWRIIMIILMVLLLGCVAFSVRNAQVVEERNRIIYEDFEGTGSKADPYLISSPEDLARLRDMVNDGTSTFKGAFFYQTDDLDLGELAGWTPIGEVDGKCYFYGVYNGGGHRIYNLNIPYEQSEGTLKYHGLFGQLGGTVLNLGIESGKIEGDYCGSITSHSIGSKAKILNCYNKATIISNGRAGGIADNFTDGQILNCWNAGELQAPTIGGIVSWTAKAVKRCYWQNGLENQGIKAKNCQTYELETLQNMEILATVNKNIPWLKRYNSLVQVWE